MDNIIIFLIGLKTHPILTFLAIIILGLFIPVILPKKLKLPTFICSFIIFSLCFLNFFAGHLLTNFLIDKFGVNGQGVVEDISQTSNLYNDEPVLRYNVNIKQNNNDTISTYCLTSDFNIAHTDSLNEYSFPQPGIKFNVRFIKEYPRAFVIIANDDSEYSKTLKIKN
ncbi:MULTISPECIES: hypothetical protein [unclassified Clostridium]|uniref:hypothetical protein n=1 Tax=unclassified Clostridium TaxID=2614128 RepID=UPI0002974FB4|nr:MULTISPECIES: hypothetical protein [unclassified Clostridium]EKQ57646.1 MAG: hypothetical protein A370_00778 [Clostridium sp. Maddingley MBC34-26]